MTRNSLAAAWLGIAIAIVLAASFATGVALTPADEDSNPCATIPLGAQQLWGECCDPLSLSGYLNWLEAVFSS